MTSLSLTRQSRCPWFCRSCKKSSWTVCVSESFLGKSRSGKDDEELKRTWRLINHNAVVRSTAPICLLGIFVKRINAQIPRSWSAPPKNPQLGMSYKLYWYSSYSTSKSSSILFADDSTDSTKFLQSNHQLQMNGVQVSFLTLSPKISDIHRFWDPVTIGAIIIVAYSLRVLLCRRLRIPITDFHLLRKIDYKSNTRESPSAALCSFYLNGPFPFPSIVKNIAINSFINAVCVWMNYSSWMYCNRCDLRTTKYQFRRHEKINNVCAILCTVCSTVEIDSPKIQREITPTVRE